MKDFAFPFFLIFADLLACTLSLRTFRKVPSLKMSALAESVDRASEELRQLREPCVIQFDTTLYPFREALLAIMNDDSDDNGALPSDDLSLMHEHKNHKCSSFDKDKSGNAIAHYQTLWNKNRDRQGEVYKRDKQAKDTDNYLVFEEIYQRFIKEVIGPSIVRMEQGEEGGGEKDEELEGERCKGISGSGIGQNGKKLASLGERAVLYQRAPTFRTYLPTAETNTPMGQPHNGT